MTNYGIKKVPVSLINLTSTLRNLDDDEAFAVACEALLLDGHSKLEDRLVKEIKRRRQEK